MKIEIKGSFLRDVKKIKDSLIKKEIKLFLEEVQNIQNIDQIKNIKKLSGYKGFYRVRIKDYRVGLYFEDDTLYLVRALHRKEVYRFFP